MLDIFDLGAPALLDILSPALAEKLNNSGKTYSYNDGELIQSRGDARPGVSIIAEGAVRIGNTGIDGSFITTAIFGPGQCFGEFTLFAGLPRTHEATAVGATLLRQIPGPEFLRLFDAEPELSHALLKISLARNHVLLEFFDDFRRLPLPVRLAKSLLTMSATAADPNLLRVRQEDLAFALGISRVSVGKVLQRLQRDGLIELGYRCIHLPEVEKLEQWVADRNVIIPLNLRA